MPPTGYSHPAYALALEDFGTPIPLRASEGWLLWRAIPGTSLYDACGCYPVFDCVNWDRLPNDICDLPDDLVTLVAVFGPFAPITTRLRSAFNCGLKPYKEHFIVDLHEKADSFVSPHHRRNIRSALRHVEVEVVAEPKSRVDEWCRLYDQLIVRHNIQGMAAFSRGSFQRQFDVPGLVMLRAAEKDETVGMILWYLGVDVAYYHLAAYSERGYQLNASFALFQKSLDWLRVCVRRLSLGAGAGVIGDPNDGLTRFKRGWATGTRTAYLARHIVNQELYDKLNCAADIASEYFPAYRAPKATTGSGSL